jgi:8-amino-7-oxononanoate synthase
LGSQGGFVAGPALFVDLLVNRARSFIFTTGLSPVSAAAALAALGVLRSGAGGRLVERLRAHVDLLAPGHPSPIVPVLLGSEAAAIMAADQLLAAGLLVPAIRPPTVPPGSSRLRISLSAIHRETDVQRLVAALASLTP